MLLRFTKMQSLGNDFVVIDAISQDIHITSELAKKLADRRYGIGCDQVLVISAPLISDADFNYRIFNNDGSEVGQCGNGARCVASFIINHQLTFKKNICLQVLNGKVWVSTNGDEMITVNMGAPIIEPKKVPFIHEHPTHNACYSMKVGRKSELVSVISMGNPHAIIRVENIKDLSITNLGEELNNSPSFPSGCNVSFMEIIAGNEINLRVYERGAGETLACGSAACACVVAGNLLGQLTPSVHVKQPGGSLIIDWSGEPSDPVYMTGPAFKTFEGQIKLSELSDP